MSKPPRDPVAMRHLEALQRDAMLNYWPGFGRPLDEAAELEAAEEVIRLRMGQPGDTPQSIVDRWRRENLEFVGPERWSRYEPSADRTFLSVAEDFVIRGMAALHEELPPSTPALGTLPTRQLNAQVIQVPDSNSYVVAFETGLSDFTSAWAKVVMACLMSHRSEQLSILFIDLVFSIVVLGTAEFAYNREIELDPAVWKRSQQEFTPIFDAFLIAHEYGHIMLGHYKSGPVAGRAASYEREFAADAYAFRLMLAAFKEQSMHVYVGASSLLLGMTLIEGGYGLFRHEKYISETHPPAHVRRDRLHQLAQEWLPDHALAEAINWNNVVLKECGRLWMPLEYALACAREFWPEPWDPSDRLKVDASGKRLKKDAAFGQFLSLIAEGQRTKK